MADMVAQLGGIARQLIALTGLIRQSEIPCRTGQTAFNRLSIGV